jgi:hypothetical protein
LQELNIIFIFIFFFAAIADFFFEEKKIMVLEEDLGTRSRHWTMPLWKTCCVVPDLVLLASACPFCVAYDHRSRLLGGDLSRYACCAGMFCGECEPCGGPDLSKVSAVLLSDGDSVVQLVWLPVQCE